MKSTISTAILAVTILAASSAGAATDPPVACQAAKTKEAGNVTKCLQGARAKVVATGNTAAYSEAVAKCLTKFSGKWQGAEQKAVDKESLCQTTGDESAIAASIEAAEACIATVLQTGDTSCMLCGNGAIDAGEDCDLGADGTGTCGSETSGRLPDGDISCTSDCTYDSGRCFDAGSPPPSCATPNAPCGSCGSGVCLPYSGGGYACFDSMAGSPSTCVGDGGCAPGQYCVSSGAGPSACAAVCE